MLPLQLVSGGVLRHLDLQLFHQINLVKSCLEQVAGAAGTDYTVDLLRQEVILHLLERIGTSILIFLVEGLSFRVVFFLVTVVVVMAFVRVTQFTLVYALVPDNQL